MLTICYVTNRKEPMFNWFAESLCNQLPTNIPIEVLVVDFFADSERSNYYRSLLPDWIEVKTVKPMPSFCQGEFKKTKVDYFDASISRNTGFVYAQYDYIAFVDDCAVLMPTWMDAVLEGMANKEIILGTYQKHTEMNVEGGVLLSSKCKSTDIDMRLAQARYTKNPAPASWFFGCSFAMPIHVAIELNGFDELQAITGYEDCPFGIRLSKAGKRLWYDKRMATVESIEHHHTDFVVKRIDPETTRENYFKILNKFGVNRSGYGQSFRFDSSHAIIDITTQSNRVESHWNGYSINSLRVLQSVGHSIDQSNMNMPNEWWFTGGLLSEME